MKPGDPYETEQTDEVRSRQRRLLRSIDTWLLRRATEGRPPLELGDEWDQGMLELGVRELVDQELAESNEMRAMVEALGQSNRLNGLARLLRSRSFVENHYLGELADSAGAKAEEIRQATSSMSRDEVYPLQLRLVRLLVLADELASDGYKDPRRVEGAPPVRRSRSTAISQTEGLDHGLWRGLSSRERRSPTGPAGKVDRARSSVPGPFAAGLSPRRHTCTLRERKGRGAGAHLVHMTVHNAAQQRTATAT